MVGPVELRCGRLAGAELFEQGQSPGAQQLVGLVEVQPDLLAQLRELARFDRLGRRHPPDAAGAGVDDEGSVLPLLPRSSAAPGGLPLLAEQREGREPPEQDQTSGGDLDPLDLLHPIVLRKAPLVPAVDFSGRDIINRSFLDGRHLGIGCDSIG
jgi:hypothetical protein